MSVRAYPTYKETYSALLARIPSHWKVTRVKNQGRFTSSGIDKLSVDGQPSTRMVNYTDVFKSQNGLVDSSKLMLTTAPAEKISEHSLKPGDILVTPSSETAEEIGRAALWLGGGEPAVYSYHIQRFRPTSAVIPQFVAYFINSQPSQQFYASVCVGTTRMILSRADLENLPFLLPPLSEQSAIVSFLDRETGKIDALMAEQERLVTLLKEKRQAVISRSVAKGLDPSMPMKDSGVEWLGKVPAHWNVMPLGRLCEEISYGFTNPMPTSDDGPFMLTANDIGDRRIKYETARRTTYDAFQKLLTNKSRPRSGDILLTKDGTLGRVAAFDGIEACINQSVAYLRLIEKHLVPFICAALADGVYQQRMIFEAGGTTIKHIYISRLSKMPIAVPPRKEAEEIAQYCAAKFAQSAAGYADADRAIVLLRERRAALISAVVTGKIDVRDLAAHPEAQAA